MVDKMKYLQRFKKLYMEKTGKLLAEEETLHLFESLVALVNAVYTLPKKGYEK